MNVYVLSGSVGVNRCHIEVFEDTEIGKKRADHRKNELQTLNNGWILIVEKYRVK